MNTVSMKDANQRFNKLCRAVDEEGIVAITRRGKEVYYMMTKDIFEGNNSFESRMVSKARNGLWVRNQDGDICRILIRDEEMQVLTMDFSNGPEIPYHCSEKILPAKAVRFEDKEPMQIIADESAEVHYAGVYPASGGFDKREEKIMRSMEQALEQKNKDRPEPIPAEFAGNRFFSM